MKVKNQNYLLLPIVSLLLVTGCGSDNSSDDGVELDGGKNNITSSQLSINFFDTQYNDSDKKDAIQRMKWIYKTGDRELIRKDIISVNEREGLNDEDLVVLGANFESIIAKRNIKVADNTITIPMDGIKSNRTETYEIELIPLDLAGVSRRESNLDENTGITSDLDYFDKIPDDVSYPENSTCYIIKETSTLPFYSFNIEDDVSSYTSMDEWTDSYSNVSRGSSPLRVESTKVGSTNQYPVVRIVYDNDARNEYRNYNALNYENTLYETEYTHQGSVSDNYDPSKGLVECGIVNDIAADFLEEQILKYY